MLLSLVLVATAADSQWIVESYVLFLAALILVHGHSGTAAGSSFYQPGGEPVPV